jgi:AbrB family looped-hinge helix DNA binding protein
MARKVTTKGQVTIPQEIRETLGIYPGSTVEFRIEDDEVVLQKVAGGRGEAVVARLRGRATTGMSTDEIMRLTRG